MTETVKLQGSTAGVSWSIWVPENHVKSLAEPLTKIHDALIHVCARGGASAHTQLRVLDGKPLIVKEEEDAKASNNVSADGLQHCDDKAAAVSSDGEQKELRSPTRIAAEQVVLHWQKMWMDRPNRQPAAARIAAATKALKLGYTAAELCDAITGYRYSKFHLGDNEHGSTYSGLRTFLRSEDRIEAGWQYLADHEGEPLPVRNHLKAIEDYKESLSKAQALHAAIDLFELFRTKEGTPGKALARWRFWQPLADIADEFPSQVAAAIQSALHQGTANPKFVRAECIRISRLAATPLKELSREQKEQRADQRAAEAYRKLGLPVPSS